MEILKYLGLTDNEIIIYKNVLQNGPSKSGAIQKSTKITSSRVYEALPKLVDLGLLTYQLLAKGKQYTAVNPDVLKEIAKKKQTQILAAIPELKSMRNLINPQSTTGVYEGYHGFKNALLDFVNDTPKNETISIIGFSNQAYKSKKLQAMLRDVNKLSKTKKQKFRIIIDNPDNEFFEGRKKENISQIRFMGEGFSSPAAIDINKTTVTIFIWAKKPLAIKIQDNTVAASFQTYFEFLWNTAKP